MMISNSIQELFDGTLGDEQTAELLHSLSVSPEKRADFRRHMALQGAMQRDRAASALTSDEDAAIWGALAGLGAASTAGGAMANYMGGVGKALTFVLVGVVGYILGSRTFFDSGDSIASGSSSVPAATAPAASSQRTGAPATGQQPSAVPAPAQPNGKPNGTGAAGTPAAASGIAPKVMYKEKIVYRDRPVAAPEGSGIMATSSSDGAGTQNGTDQANASSRQPQTQVAPTLSDTNSGSAKNSENSGSTPSQAQPTDSGAKPSEAISSRSIDPSEAFRQTPDAESPVDEASRPTASLWTNGLELSYGEYAGRLYGSLATDNGSESDPNYFSRHFDLTYRFGDGRFGFGARLGYGTFSRVSLYLDYNVRTGTVGELTRADTMYRVRVRPEKQTLLEFLVNYRQPITDNLGIGVEGSWGQSPYHMKAGGSLMINWLLTDHIGLHAGGGVNRYWYNYVGDQRKEILENGADGISISDKVQDSYNGMSFEGRYGIFYHF